MLVVAGDVTADEVKALAEKTYGKIAQRTAARSPAMRPQEPPQIAERRVTFADLRVTQPSLQRSYLVPSYTTAKDNEGEALDVLAHVLGGGSNSRLNRALVVEQRLATSAGCWYQGTSLDATRFGFERTPRPASRWRRSRPRSIPQIAAFLDKGPTAEELDRSKNRMIADFVYAQDNTAELARMYGAR